LASEAETEETTGARSSMQQTSSGRIVAQERYASRLPRIVAKQDYLGAILLPFWDGRVGKCDRAHTRW
jgi:hypothetical protein